MASIKMIMPFIIATGSIFDAGTLLIGNTSRFMTIQISNPYPIAVSTLCLAKKLFFAKRKKKTVAKENATR